MLVLSPCCAASLFGCLPHLTFPQSSAQVPQHWPSQTSLTGLHSPDSCLIRVAILIKATAQKKQRVPQQPCLGIPCCVQAVQCFRVPAAPGGTSFHLQFADVETGAQRSGACDTSGVTSPEPQFPWHRTAMIASPNEVVRPGSSPENILVLLQPTPRSVGVTSGEPLDTKLKVGVRLTWYLLPCLERGCLSEVGSHWPRHKEAPSTSQR